MRPKTSYKQALRIQSPCQMMIRVYNHLRNARHLGSITILSFGEPESLGKVIASFVGVMWLCITPQCCHFRPIYRGKTHLGLTFCRSTIPIRSWPWVQLLTLAAICGWIIRTVDANQTFQWATVAYCKPEFWVELLMEEIPNNHLGILHHRLEMYQTKRK